MQQQTSIALPSITPITKKVLIALLVLYIVEMIAHQTGLFNISSFVWNSDKGFQLWQPLSCFFMLDVPHPNTGNFSPFRVLIDMLMVAFFLPPTEISYRRKGLYKVIAFTVGLSVLLGAIFSVTGIAMGYAYGIEAFLSAFLAVFCFSRPRASILLFFILPVKAEWIGWATGLISLLFLIATRDLNFVLHLSGWLAGLFFLATRRKGPLKQIYKKTFGRPKAAKKPFVIIQGGKDDGDVYH